MLYYCAAGVRNYHTKPIRIYNRPYWEFMVFLRGNSCLTMKDSKTFDSRQNFWILRPDCAHGWKESENRECEVAVFHFREVPSHLMSHMETAPYLSCRIEEDLCGAVREKARKVVDEVKKPEANSQLLFQLCQVWLSYIFLENAHLQPAEISREEQIVNAAIAWFSSHMEEGVGVQETADKLGYNISHIRRLFKVVKGRSPHEILNDLKMDRAKGLLRQGTPILETALACGFNSHSSFTRAFTAYSGMSPKEMGELLQNL